MNACDMLCLGFSATVLLLVVAVSRTCKPQSSRSALFPRQAERLRNTDKRKMSVTGV